MFEWNSHRFSGGALALDLTNTVVWSDVSAKRTDRFEDSSLIASFAQAATVFRRDELTNRTLVPPNTAVGTQNLLRLRDEIDLWLRPVSEGKQLDVPLHGLFAACANASSATLSDRQHISLGEACALSAMRFVDQKVLSRLKSCPSCRWLYLDNSKNQSRQWCDMKVCGNRAKARTFYSRQKLSLAEN
jgi:predicted RNA-binding Zn ribbon-like protein